MTAAAVNVALRDGSTLRVRQVQPDDEERMRSFLGALSAAARGFRFFSAAVDLDAAARACVAGGAGLGLAATTGTDAHVVGHAAYLPTAGDRAEVAFAVADDWQGHGIATILLAHLAEAAAAQGITTFSATVLPATHRMIAVFRDSGFPVDVRSHPGELDVLLPTTLDEAGRRRFEDRERDASVAAVSHFLRPASVAVVGASRRPGTVGGEVMRSLLAGGFTGALHAVNPHATEIMGVPAFPSVCDMSAPVELAVIAVPAADVVAVARDCAATGVRALVVLSAGFAEAGEEGARRQAELMEVCRAGGMRVIGPNCLGVLNTDPDVALDATFAPGAPPRGRVAFASQSGAFGIAAIDEAAARGVGLSSFVSAGNKADLSGNDLLRYWEQDAGTDVMALYLESFGNPAKFARVARAVTATKPIVAVKSGRSRAGRRAASSHTGALLAAADTSVDALFRHAGVVRTDTVGEMFDVAALLARQPLPRGDRVALVTNAGGPAILAADACEAAGLRVEPLAAATQQSLAERLRPEASVANPVDMIASATAADYETVVSTVVADPGVDAVITIFVRPLATRAADVAAAIEAAARTEPTRPVLAVFMGGDAPPPPPPGGGVARFAGPEEAARALGHALQYARHRNAPPDPPAELDAVDPDRAAAIIATGLGAGGGWLEPGAVEALLGAYGVPVVASRLASSPREAALAAAALGGNVALKAVAPGLVHKSDAGGVRLDLAGSAVERAAGELAEAVRAAGHEPEGFLVQAMAPAGTELLVGVVGDPSFGPLIAVGAGGETAELVGDVQVRLAPVGPREASEMLRALRTFPLLDGFRGRPQADAGAVEEIVQRVARLASDHPAIAELDCNPVIAAHAGALVVDARVRLDVPPPRRPYAALDR